jgi:hypothetical protein
MNARFISMRVNIAVKNYSDIWNEVIKHVICRRLKQEATADDVIVRNLAVLLKL